MTLAVLLKKHVSKRGLPNAHTEFLVHHTRSSNPAPRNHIPEHGSSSLGTLQGHSTGKLNKTGHLVIPNFPAISVTYLGRAKGDQTPLAAE
jgi:hypothetical protein